VIVRLEKHPTDKALCVAKTHPDMREVMGHFQPARYSPDHRGYLIEDRPQLLTDFGRLLARHGHHLADERSKPMNPETVSVVLAQPLPECVHCGLPRKRTRVVGGQPVPLDPPPRCPSCSRPWVDARPPANEQREALTRTCPACHSREYGRFPHCSRCGAFMAQTLRLVEPIPVDTPSAQRSEAEPVLVGELVEAVLDISIDRGHNRRPGEIA
jgi:hypothetical protein